MNLQTKMESCNREIVEELKAFNEKFVMLEFDLGITKNVNNLLPSQLVEAEKQ